MKRKEFLKRSAALGLSLPFLSQMLISCGEDDFNTGNFEVNFDGKVLIIGAGAAGMTAGYILSRHNVDFEIIEASAVHGGRMKKDETLADFPIDLGAEWLHDEPAMLAQLLDNSNIQDNIELIDYSPETISVWKNGKLRKRNFFSNFYAEYKFKSTTWWDYFKLYMMPEIGNRIRYSSPVTAIDYSGDQLSVETANNEVITGERIILTVPLTILKNESINFTPAYPADKFAALDEVDMPDGIKVFIKFRKRFYPDLAFEGGILENASGEGEGENIYYDAAFRKDTQDHILGLFSVGAPASVYANQPTEEALMAYIMSELDEWFDGQASANYKAHVIQNWSQDPYIGGSYSHYQNEDVQSTLIRPIDNKVFFAGETYSPSASIATVHGAAQSAYIAVERLLKNEG